MHNVSGWVYIEGMEKHEVVNEIIEYLCIRRLDLASEMKAISYMSTDYIELEAMHEVYDHLIAKLEDDFR